jgi:anti-sigma regulatory factor (Ser/Thr protein kinase)
VSADTAPTATGRLGVPPSDDVITLTVPRDARFTNVARLVVGGLAARLDIAYESLDDLQLGVETLLSADHYATADEITIELTARDRSVEALVGPVDVERLQADLAAEDQDDGGLGLGRLLAAVVDEVGFERRAEGWVRLSKRLPIRAPS